MRVGVIGFGVIGTIYGCVLAEAGHDVLHTSARAAPRRGEQARR
jgi:ketopantoate reductase